MNTHARLKKIEKVLREKYKPEKLYYPIQIEFVDFSKAGVPADKNGMPPPILSLLNESEKG
jgi:hypothetical protein